MAASSALKKKPLKSKKSISVFFPAYNDEASIEKMVLDALQVLKKVSSDYGAIVVDDASPGRTGRIADNLAKKYPRIKVVHHRKNRGYGSALKSGFKAASKELIFYTDGDAQFDAKELEMLLPIEWILLLA